MKKVWLGLLFTMIFAVLAACGNNEDSESASDSDSDENLWEAVQDRGFLTVGTEGTYAPFTFHDDNGDLTGYDVDVITEAANRLDLDVQFEETQWDSMFSGLNSSRFDLIANQVGKTEEREEQYAFSDPYTVSQSVVVTAADNDEITSIEDVEGKTAAQSLTSNYNNEAEAAGANIEGVEGLAQSIQLIEQGRADVTFNNNLAVLDYLKNSDSDPVKIAFETGEPSETYFTFRKDTDDELIENINNALNEMREDGTLVEISEKWFGEDVTE